MARCSACFLVMGEPPFCGSSTFDNRWHPVGGKPHIFRGIKIGDRLDQTDATNLEQIVRALPPFIKALDHAEHQPQISLDQLLPGPFVPGPGTQQQRVHFRLTQHFQLGGIYAADFYLSLHSNPPVVILLFAKQQYLPHGQKHTSGKFVRFHQIIFATPRQGHLFYTYFHNTSQLFCQSSPVNLFLSAIT